LTRRRASSDDAPPPAGPYEHFAEMNAAYEEFFEAPLPARTTIQSDFRQFDVEIDAVVWLGE
jgi:enamine deaminase RidA (YjgF/YER057c/UK114 family)